MKRNCSNGRDNRNHSRQGFTVIELMFATLVFLVAIAMLSSAVGGVSAQRTFNRETARASEAARSTLERMRNVDFSLVFANYNSNPADDPLGAGTAVGHRFEIEDLTPSGGSPDGLHGEIVFPTTGSGTGLQLREDIADRPLGMPRDLNADSMVDGADHGGDYFVLPVLVRVRWESHGHERELSTFTLLTRTNKQ